MITVVIVDEEALFRLGLCQALAKQSDFKVLDCGPAREPLLEMVEDSSPDVVVLGTSLHTHHGLSLAREIARCYPYTRVILLSPEPDDEVLFETIKTAAVACLSKNVGAEELISTIRRAYLGEYPINDSLETRPLVARRVLKQFADLAAMRGIMETVIAPLTHRETQILNHITEGNTNKEIAYRLGISEQTVKGHVSAILRKLNANDRAHAVALVMRPK